MPQAQNGANDVFRLFTEPINRKPHLELLEDKLQALENEIEAFSRRPAALSHDLLRRFDESGPSRRIASQPRPFLPILPNVTLNQGFGSVTVAELDEGYYSVVSRSDVEASLRRWTNETPLDLRENLVRLFLPFRHHFNFRMNIPSFLQKLRLPESHPRSIHPGLMDAISLAACSLGGGSMSGFESFFLNRTRTYLQQALAYGNRLMHFMWASVILSCYYARAGRIVEAHNTISATVMFAVGCGLHKKAVIVNGAPYAMLAPPADEIEANERAALWNAIFISDSTISGASGLPVSFPGDNIASMHALFPSTPGRVANGDYLIDVKAVSLFETIREYASASKDASHDHSHSFWGQFKSLASVLAEFQRTLPPPDDPWGLQPGEIVSPTNPYIVHAHMCSQVCTMLLYNIIIHHDANAYHKVLDAAYSMASLVRRIRGSRGSASIQTPCSLISRVYCGCEVLIREIVQIRSSSLPEPNSRLDRAENALGSLLDMLFDLTLLYPSWLQSIRGLRDLLLGNGSYEYI
ncbi:hypothetical protein BS47DRAFT_1398903 [Hydnum rufescens UP504]|uniref:Transcription factor domain-containing protein n=1 Tax=Hydnum rufescens UP504 TaxID=1448309 RepID=A0A9P6AJR2_9AGAM|nr:hypothetical protein BS47DRAFT_1398903 [Hydnum rufescens UP504]